MADIVTDGRSGDSRAQLWARPEVCVSGKGVAFAVAMAEAAVRARRSHRACVSRASIPGNRGSQPIGGETTFIGDPDESLLPDG